MLRGRLRNYRRMLGVELGFRFMLMVGGIFAYVFLQLYFQFCAMLCEASHLCVSVFVEDSGGT